MQDEVPADAKRSINFIKSYGQIFVQNFNIFGKFLIFHLISQNVLIFGL